MSVIGSNQYILTWSHFAELHADKKTAFENLSRALFFRELCLEGNSLHSDPNHPGVEVAPVLAKDGINRISFQAKHFDNQVGYSQIKKSVVEAVTHYAGKLDVIYLYCNKDITETSKGYREIVNILTESRIKMELVTGQAILDQALNYPQLLSCYFGLDNLDESWFQGNIKLSLDNLGTRYNSLFNIATYAQRNISLFLRETSAIVEVNDKKNKLINNLKNLRLRCNRKYDNEIKELSRWVKALVDVDKATILSSLKWKERLENECDEIFVKFRDRLTIIQNELKKHSYDDPLYEKIRDEEDVVRRVLGITSYLEFSKKESCIMSSKIAIINGEMGTGKTQLLATAAKRMVENGRPALLFLGQTFITDESIEYQMMKSLEGISTGQNFESLVSVMDEKSISLGEDAVIFIDAINESNNRDIWKNGINRIIATLERYSHVKLIISLRTGFEWLTLSQSVMDQLNSGEIATIMHTGLVDESPQRIFEFLSNYGIPFSPECYLHSEMTNPLFLTWFCATYNGEENGLLMLIDKVLKQADKEGSKAAGLSEPVGLLKPLIYEMLDKSANGVISREDLFELLTWSKYGVTRKNEYLKAIERAGVLTSYVREQEENYYIGYNLLGDYLNASKIIEREQSKEKIIEYCERSLLEIDDEGNINNSFNEPIFVMVASLYAIIQGGELLEVIDKVRNTCDKNALVDKYCSSFIWRSSYISYDGFLKFIIKYQVEHRRVWEVFIENSVKEKSELNALGLTKLLNRYPMNKRDYLWTRVINEFNESDRIISLAYYIESGNKLYGLTDNKAYFLLITYIWMLSSSNRILRDRVSKAIIEILKEHFSLCIQLLESFKEVNDPYILQRLYGILFGAVMKRECVNKSEFKALAQWVYKEIFDKDMVYPDILLRDYARLIVERFALEFPNDLDEILLQKIKPPYKSEPIPKVKEVDYSLDIYHNNGLLSLLYSMKFDMNVKGMGMYGDFGRYVFQSALDSFVDLDIGNIYYYAIQYILNNLRYEPQWFADYDEHICGYDRYNVKRVERIGKKYQWIAMYNILARLSDTHRIKSSNWNDKIGLVYEGPWNPYVRDFDPTLNIKIKANKNIPKLSLPVYGKESFCDINSSVNDIKKWVIEDDKMFQDFPARFIQKDERGIEWVSLFIYQNNVLRPEKDECSVSGWIKGEQHVWTSATMYILPKKKIKYTEQDLISSGFVNCIVNRMQRSYTLYSREYAWSPGYYAEFRNIDDFKDEAGLNAFSATIDFLWESEYDGSQIDSTSFVIPTGHIIQTMLLYTKDVDGVFYKNEDIVALDLSIFGNKYNEFVIRKDVLDEYIKKTGVQAFWAVIGEKQCFIEFSNQEWLRREGYFIYDKNEIVGKIHLVNHCT